jgi:hypothetical protein
MQLIEIFKAHANDGTEHLCECWCHDTASKTFDGRTQPPGRLEFRLPDGQLMKQVDDGTFFTVQGRTMLRRDLADFG